MSNQEKVARGMTTKKKEPQKPALPNKSFTFRPTKVQREVIKEQWSDPEKNLEVLADYLENGCKLSLGYVSSTNALFASLRERAANWEEARAVSVWHADIARLFSMLAYYLREINEDFPDGIVGSINPEDMKW